MISLFLLKKLLITSSFVSIYLAYFSVRINSKLRSRRNSLSLGAGSYDIYFQYNMPHFIKNPIINYHSTGRSLYIKYEVSSSFMENAAQFLEKYSNINIRNFFKTGLYDICGDSGKNCVTSDLRAFIQAYFSEISSQKDSAIFQDYTLFMSTFYKDNPFVERTVTLKRDSEGILLHHPKGEEYLKSVGFMLSLALVTETFLDLKFAVFFLGPRTEKFLLNILPECLARLDLQQWRIYNQIRLSSDDKLFRYDPNSAKPFKLADDIENLDDGSDILLFEKKEFPFHLAAEKFIVVPYQKSEKLIESQIVKFFEHYIKNSHDPYSGDFQINFDKMFASQNPSLLHLILWKDNSVYDNSSRMFWKALNSFSEEDLMKIFIKATGLNIVPCSQFKRLPKTRLISYPNSEIIFVPSRYEIYVPSYATFDEMVAALKKKL